jgi:acyl dehydratase
MADWSKQRFYEDVQVGDQVPSVTINVTVERLIEYAAAVWQFHPIHHNTRFAQKTGAPDMYANNTVVQGWIERTAREYLGLDGRIKRVGPLRIRTFSCPGDTVVTKGTVKRKWQEDGKSFVELELLSEHQRGVCVAPTRVIATLPSRGG